MKSIISKTIIFLSVILLFSGCVTKELWEGKNHYDESVQSFNIEENNLIVVGKKYHYIFKIDNKLKKLLLSEDRKGISFKAHNFDIDKNNNVNGNIFLQYKKEKYAYLENLGFHQSQNSAVIEIELIGTRYLPRANFHYENKFSKEYKIQFRENWSKYDKSTKVLLSPLSVIADGVLMVVGIGVAVPLILVSYEVSALIEPFNN